MGCILNITLEDHLIISPFKYVSFKAKGIMDELEKSTLYVPSYQLIDKIRKEEKAIVKEAVKVAKEKTAQVIKEKKCWKSDV